MTKDVFSVQNPLKPPGNYAMGVLLRISMRPFPHANISPAVSKKLLQVDYIKLEKRPERQDCPTPEKEIDYMVITQRGMIALDSFRKNRRAARLFKGGLI